MRLRLSAVVLFAGLTLATAPRPAGAQAPASQTATSQSSALAGPRLPTPAPAVKYRLPGETGHENDAMSRRRTTIRISTLALVVGIIVLAILIS